MKHKRNGTAGWEQKLVNLVDSILSQELSHLAEERDRYWIEKCKEIIGEDTEMTGLPFIDEPGAYNNIMRREQRKNLDALITNKENRK